MLYLSIPLQLLQFDKSPLLGSLFTIPLFQSFVYFFSFHICTMRKCSNLAVASTSALKISGGMLLKPGAFLSFSCLMAVLTSSSVGESVLLYMLLIPCPVFSSVPLLPASSSSFSFCTRSSSSSTFLVFM